MLCWKLICIIWLRGAGAEEKTRNKITMWSEGWFKMELNFYIIIAEHISAQNNVIGYVGHQLLCMCVTLTAQEVSQLHLWMKRIHVRYLHYLTFVPRVSYQPPTFACMGGKKMPLSVKNIPRHGLSFTQIFSQAFHMDAGFNKYLNWGFQYSTSKKQLTWYLNTKFPHFHLTLCFHE